MSGDDHNCRFRAGGAQLTERLETVYSRQPGINGMTASRAVLLALPGVTPATTFVPKSRIARVWN